MSKGYKIYLKESPVAKTENSMNNDGIDFNPENILYESILIQKND